MTIKEAESILTPLGITLHSTPHLPEYRVRVKGSPADHGYYTTELQDAVRTGKLMAAQHHMEIKPGHH